MRTIHLRFKNSIACLLVIALLVVSSPAHAFWGMGDVTFDPSSYGELISLYEQAQQAWDTAKSTLDSMQKVENTINQARQGVEALENFNLKQAAQQLANGGGIGASSDKIAALRSEMSNVEGTVGGNTSYVKYQLQRINNLEKLSALQDQSAKNLGIASAQTSADQNTKLTAQSTSTLATLAAAEHQRNVEQQMAAAADVQNRQKLKSDSTTIYDAVKE